MFEDRQVHAAITQFRDSSRESAKLFFREPHRRCVVRISTKKQQQLVQTDQRLSIPKPLAREALEQRADSPCLLRSELRLQFVELIEQITE